MPGFPPSPFVQVRGISDGGYLVVHETEFVVPEFVYGLTTVVGPRVAEMQCYHSMEPHPPGLPLQGDFRGSSGWVCSCRVRGRSCA
jgi:hypothetical protein